MNGDILNWCIKNERIWHIQKGCGMKRVSKSASATMAIMKKFFFTMTSILKWLIVNSLFFVANFRQYFVFSKYMTSHFLHFFMLEFTKSTLLLTNVKSGGWNVKLCIKPCLLIGELDVIFSDMLDCLFVIKTDWLNWLLCDYLLFLRNKH